MNNLTKSFDELLTVVNSYSTKVLSTSLLDLMNPLNTQIKNTKVSLEDKNTKIEETKRTLEDLEKKIQNIKEDLETKSTSLKKTEKEHHNIINLINQEKTKKILMILRNLMIL